METGLLPLKCQVMMETTKSKSALEESGQGRKFDIPEITGLIHHPHKGVVAAFSNDKTQKRGLVTLWK